MARRAFSWLLVPSYPPRGIRCSEPLRVVPTASGSWTTDECSCGCLSDSAEFDDVGIVVLPSHDGTHLRSVWREKESTSVATTTNDRSPSDGVVPQSSHLLQLPAEVLSQILRYLLPEREVFHFLPITENGTNAILMHRLVKIDDDTTSPSDYGLPGSLHDKLQFLPVVSSVCRRLTDIVYTMFFRDNQFVFEVAPVGLVSAVDVEYNIWTFDKVHFGTPCGLAPLGPIAAKYLTSLTLSIAITSCIPTRHQGSQLQDSIKRIAQLFEGSAHKLKSLTIDVEYGTRSRNGVTTHRLEASLSDGLRMRIREGSQDGTESKAKRMPNTQHTVRLLELIVPLIWLEVEDLQVSGLLTAEDVRAYKEALLRDGKRSIEEAKVGQPAKKSRHHE